MLHYFLATGLDILLQRYLFRHVHCCSPAIAGVMQSSPEKTIQSVYRQLKVFIPSGWDYTQAYSAPSVWCKGHFKGKATFCYLVKQLQDEVLFKQSDLTEAKISKYGQLGIWFLE